MLESCPYIHDNSDNINEERLIIKDEQKDKNHVIVPTDYAQYIIMMLMPTHIMAW